MLSRNIFLQQRRLIFLLFFILVFGKTLQAQDLQQKLKSVKVSNVHSLNVGIYLFEANDCEKQCDFNKEDIVRRYSDRFFMLNVNKGNRDKVARAGTIYKVSNDWKLGQGLQQQSFKGTRKFSVHTTDAGEFIRRGEFQILTGYGNFMVVRASASEFKKLLEHELVTHISQYQRPEKEAPVSLHDLTVNAINLVHNKFPALDGQGIKISIKEQLFDTTDIDIKNRYELLGTEADKVDQHATLVATLIAGAGNSSDRGNGVAPGAILSSSSFLDLFPHEPQFYTGNNIYVQNHSYGTAPEQEYGNEAAAFDQNVNEVPELVHVFSSGNMGTAAPDNGPYQGITGFANLTGNFKMAKNIITVGAVDKYKQVVERSSKGPAYDGRIKPELVAYAPAGTSDAAALVSGTVALLQELYKERENSLPDAALIKAVLVAGAEDVGRPEIDFSSGYGNLNALQSVKIINSGTYRSAQLEPGEDLEFSIEVPAGSAELKVALSWNDPAANPGDAVALVNDLDLLLESANGEVWKPWILNSQPQVENLMQIATRGRDSLNPVELVTIKDPEEGNYTIKVSAEELSATQKFSLAYTILPQNEFSWSFPTSKDPLLVNGENILRWTESFAEENARLEFKMGDAEWQVLSEDIDLGSESFTWTPTNSGKGQFRMIFGEEIFESEMFAITPEIVPQVLFNCDEEFMLAWNKVEGAGSYQVQALGEKYMEEVTSVQDTVITINKEDFGSGYWSVIPVFDAVEGLQGRAIQIMDQGVECHYRNFFAILEEKEGVQATLNLSNSPLVSEVKFFRENEENMTEIGRFSAPFYATGLVAEDKELVPGNNLYTAVIILKDGTEIITEPVNIFIPGQNTFITYPNPVREGEDLYILSKGDDLEFEIFDVLGRKISEDHLIHYTDRIEVRIKDRGLYIVRASRKGKKIGAAKVIVE